MRRESNFNPGAVGKAGEIGLMQTKPDTAKDVGVTDLRDPEQQIKAGVKYYASLLKRFNGDDSQALTAYNFGIGNLEKGRPVPDMTKKYVADILAQAESDSGPSTAQREPSKNTPPVASNASTDLYAGTSDVRAANDLTPAAVFQSTEFQSLSPRKQEDLRTVFEAFQKGDLTKEVLTSSVHAVLDDAFGMIRAEWVARALSGSAPSSPSDQAKAGQHRFKQTSGLIRSVQSGGVYG